MPSEKKQLKRSEFVRFFADYDDSALITVRQWAELCEQSSASIYAAKSRGLLPTPAIEKNRVIRWTAGQYRAWARSLTEAAPAHRRGGRPRKETQQPGESAA